MSPLDRALALEEVDDAPLPVAEHLELDVPRTLDRALDVHRALAKDRFRLGLGDQIAVPEAFLVAGDPHPLPAAARHRLDHDRVADLGGEPHRRLDIGDRAFAPRHHRHPGGAHHFPGLGLVAHEPDRFRRRADEVDVVRLADLGEVRPLGEEAVSGMDRVAAGDLGRAHDARDVQVALGRRRRANADCLVREAHVQCLAIRLGIDGHRAHVHLLTGAQHSHRDLPAVRDQDLLKHAGVLRPSTLA